ncbi:hypothetical protein ISU10_20110 [Nocardioides agariphilus]|jgi:hypothetical protein|uniref:CBU-0592-like domain-containing protein n=1 Tax=Nocardioides agariphilus TaxID=433664 RepID=A0A930YPB9_9ACTN|nr:hypothetical protein [Nocardioides agariphilus]MBF4770084.1 hypothetical protein [Nocardioides agariphilus]
MIAAAMGWIGTIGTIGAYVMLSQGHWDARSLRYGLLNIAGGILCGTASAAYGAWPSVASNVVWSAVALHSVVATVRQRRRRPLAAVVPLRPLDPEPALARAA